jgi:hypothetical protein
MEHYIPRTVRAAIIMTIACLASVALTNCSRPLSTRTVTNPTPSPTQLQLTGTALKSALLPLSGFPAGYAVDTQGSSDSGSSLLSGTSSPTPTQGDCEQLVSDTMSFPPGLTAGATQELHSTTGHSSEFHQTLLVQAIFQFSTPSMAAGFIDSLRSAFARCPLVTDTADGITAVYRSTTEPAPPVAGHQALLLRHTGTVSRALRHTDRVPAVTAAIYTLDGTDVYLAVAGSVGVPFPAQVSLPEITTKLIARVQALG